MMKLAVPLLALVVGLAFVRAPMQMEAVEVREVPVEEVPADPDEAPAEPGPVAE